MNIPESSSPTQQRLIGDLRLVIENAEELLKNTDHYTGVVYQNARAKLATALTAANELHHDMSGEARILRAFHYH